MLRLVIGINLFGISFALFGIHLRPTQSVGVRGTLLCNGRPESNVLVKLYDHDTFTLDDLMAKGKSDSRGQFLLNGKANEISRVTPRLNIYHDCNDGLMPCQRKLTIEIPKSFITRGGSNPQQIYDIGALELANKVKGESRDCLHK
uniref:Transthyretin-like protein 5 n=1 Tax=Acrobeloides nanus TaxID=290746 RepID=A0A914DZQ0_9BILA